MNSISETVQKRTVSLLTIHDRLAIFLCYPFICKGSYQQKFLKIILRFKKNVKLYIQNLILSILIEVNLGKGSSWNS